MKSGRRRQVFLQNTLKYKKEQEKAVDKTRGSKGKKKKKLQLVLQLLP